MDSLATASVYARHRRNIINTSPSLHRVSRRTHRAARERESNEMRRIYIRFHGCASASVSVDLPRRNINVIDILLRASIKEKHRGRMKYAAFPGGEGFPTLEIRLMQC